MVYAVYIAAAAAVGLLIGFVVLSIVWLRKTVSRNIRSKTVGLISVYDELLEQKSQELAGPERPEEQQPASTVLPPEPIPQPAAFMRGSELLNVAERSGGAVYRDRAVGGIYRKIRDNFSFSLEELLPALSGAPRAVEGPASRLLRQLDFDTVYQLSTLPQADQAAILKDTLPPESFDLLRTYLDAHRTFSVLEFYDHLKALADAEPKTVCLRVPPGMIAGRSVGSGVKVIPDSSICEGFQLEEGRLLYDYCIKTRELS